MNSDDTPISSGSQSPIGKLLESLGMTRDDLTRHSAQMRQFLTADNGSLRALEQSQEQATFPSNTTRDTSLSNTSSHNASYPSLAVRSDDFAAHREATTPQITMPPHSVGAPSALSSENLAKHSQQIMERDASRRHREREQRRRSRAISQSSPTMMRVKPSLDMVMQLRSRGRRRVTESEDSEESDVGSIKDVFSSRKNKTSKPHSQYRYPHPALPGAAHSSKSTAPKQDTRPRSYYREDAYKEESPAPFTAGGSYYRDRTTPQENRATPQTRRGSEAGCTPQIPAPPSQPRAIQEVSDHRLHDQSQKQALLLSHSLFPNQPPAQIQPQNYQQAVTQSAATPISIHSFRRPSDTNVDVLPPSSPIPQSSPISSSPVIAFNIVSSPSRLDSDPAEVTDTNLPFTLPPGPYSDAKPDLSYAALIGRAILASPQHKLRLKDIYDYISIVFPFYKREGHSHGQKWMNAIRQNLTNTPQFYKELHPDGTSKGSLWCISDRDLPCFADGLYSRHALQQQTKPEKRKRKREEEQQKLDTKRVQLMSVPSSSSFPNPYHFPYGYPPNSHLPFQPPDAQVQYYYDQQGILVTNNVDALFPPLPPSHPSAHLVNGTQQYEHVMDTSEDPDTLFPPLPAFSQTRMVREARLRELAEAQSATGSPSESDSDSSPATAPPMSTASSSMSVPDLTPNNSSSSPVEEDVPDIEAGFSGDDDVQIYNSESSVSDVHSIRPSVLLRNDKGKGRATETVGGTIVLGEAPFIPSTPKGKRSTVQPTRKPAVRISFEKIPASVDTDDDERPSTPSRPCTPPNKPFSITFNTSLMRTPIAEKTPTRNNVKFKETAEEGEASGAAGDEKTETYGFDSVFKTPSRKAAETPKGLFPAPWTISPFRTPSRRHTLDPADPRLLLDDELAALASAQSRGLQDSPIGFFGHGKGLLYESPSLPSPSQHWRPW